MFIRYISIENFGGIDAWEASLKPELNLLDSRHTEEIAAAVSALLCHSAASVAAKQWLRAQTRLAATVCLDGEEYTVCAYPRSGRLRLLATDRSGAEVTAQYQYALSHCAEQDAVEIFDGNDPSPPLLLARYYCREKRDGLSGRTERLTDTQTFRSYLRRYIRDFHPETIPSRKDYQATLNSLGEFEVTAPGCGSKCDLSETEKKLFRYVCFLNVAEFWADIEKIRDLHHERKPLLIQNFLEFLDESVCIDGLIARTQQLERQIILLTSPLDEEIKKKWMGEGNGVFFQPGNGIYT